MTTHEHGAGCSHSKQASSQLEQRREQNDVVRKLYTASALCCVFLVVEISGGLIAGSLAVLSDAAHLFADLAGFMVAIAASHLAALPTTNQHTFGLKRMESLAALFSMVCLAMVSVALALEAVRRLLAPPDEGVDGKLMSGIAMIGVIVNIILAFVLGEHHVHMPGGGGHAHDHEHDSENHDDHAAEAAAHHHHHSSGHDDIHAHEEETGALSGGHDHDHQHGYGSVHSHDVDVEVPEKRARNINLEAAYIHVLGDLAQSVAVLIAGVVIWFKPAWHIVDPIATLLFCSLVFYSTLGVLRSSISVLLEEVPPNIDWDDIYTTITKVEGVSNVHDLHIWSISHGVPTLSVHCMASDPELALKSIYTALERKGIKHATIQVQLPDVDCTTCAVEEGCDTTRISQKINAAKLELNAGQKWTL